MILNLVMPPFYNNFFCHMSLSILKWSSKIIPILNNFLRKKSTFQHQYLHLTSIISIIYKKTVRKVIHGKLLWMSTPSVLWHCYTDKWAEMFIYPLNSQTPRPTDAGQVWHCLPCYHFPNWWLILVKSSNPKKYSLPSTHSNYSPWKFRSYFTCAKRLCLNVQMFSSRLVSLWMKFSYPEMKGSTWKSGATWDSSSPWSCRTSGGAVPCVQNVSSVLPYHQYYQKCLQ